MTTQTYYKGMKIETTNTSHCAYIYNGEELIKCISGDILKDGSHNAIEKAKKYIETLTSFAV